MMTKRISIFALTFLFLFSTTGLPFYSHYCEMMKQKSLSECEVCMIEMQKVETSCCEMKEIEKQVQITSQNPVCCQDEFIYNKVEDEFLYNKSELTFLLSFEIFCHSFAVIPQSIDFQKNESFYCDSSPPFLINPELHITNSNLLI